MEKRIDKILEYLNKYNRYAKNKEVINYYKLFNIAKNKDITEIQKEIKKLRILFHPDNLLYIPDKYQNDFSEISKLIIDMQSCFSSHESRKNYDDILEEFLENCNDVEYVLELNADKLNYAVVENIKKCGFLSTFISLGCLLNTGKVSNFTKVNKVKQIISELGRGKVIAVLKNYDFSKELGVKKIIINYFVELVKNDKELFNKFNCYLNACYTTLAMYGENHAYCAIRNLYGSNLYEGFVEVNGSRKKLRDNVLSSDVIILMFIYFEYFNSEFKNSDVSIYDLSSDEVIGNFVNDLSKQKNYFVKKTAKK